MKKRYKRLLQNIALLLFVIVIFLVFCEITLRILKISASYDYPKGMYQKDSLLGYRMTSNFVGEIIKPEFKTDIYTNSQGLRDVEYGEKTENEYRILALGDSFTWGGYGTELEETYLKLLEKKLNQENGMTFRVINAGVPGYNTQQEFLYLKERGIVYKPDMILLSFVLNDFMENSINLEDIIIKDGVKVADEAKTGVLLEVRSFLLINFWSYRSFERGITNLLGKLVQKLVNKDIKDTKRLVGLFLKDTSSDSNSEVKLTFEILDDMNDFLKDEDIPFVIVIIPLKYQVDDSLKQKFIEINNLNLDDLDFEKPQTMIKNWARKNDVIIIDLLPGLKSENKNNDFYWNLNPHFNKEGNEKVADIIFNYLSFLIF